MTLICSSSLVPRIQSIFSLFLHVAATTPESPFLPSVQAVPLFLVWYLLVVPSQHCQPWWCVVSGLTMFYQKPVCNHGIMWQLQLLYHPVNIWWHKSKLLTTVMEISELKHQFKGKNIQGRERRGFFILQLPCPVQTTNLILAIRKFYYPTEPQNKGRKLWSWEKVVKSFLSIFDSKCTFKEWE